MEERENNELAYEILPEDFPHYDLYFKIILLGNSNVGKSELVMNATKNTFEESDKSTVGFEFFPFNMKIGNKVIKLQIWDFDYSYGQEIYFCRTLRTSFYNNTYLAIIIYAINE